MCFILVRLINARVRAFKEGGGGCLRKGETKGQHSAGEDHGATNQFGTMRSSDVLWAGMCHILITLVGVCPILTTLGTQTQGTGRNCTCLGTQNLRPNGI